MINVGLNLGWEFGIGNLRFVESCDLYKRGVDWVRCTKGQEQASEDFI